MKTDNGIEIFNLTPDVEIDKLAIRLMGMGLPDKLPDTIIPTNKCKVYRDFKILKISYEAVKKINPVFDFIGNKMVILKNSGTGNELPFYQSELDDCTKLSSRYELREDLKQKYPQLEKWKLVIGG